MAKRFYTCIIVPHANHRLHKLRIPARALHVLGVIGVLSFFVGVALAFSYIGMAVKVADYDKLQAENGELRTQTSQLKHSAEQLDSKITALETKSKDLTRLIENDALYSRGAQFNTKTAGGSRENLSTTELLDENLRKALERLRDRTAGVESELSVLEPVLKNRKTAFSVTPSDWPLRGAIGSPYGNRLDPFTGDREMHVGIDIIGMYRAPVKAPADGRVIYAARKSDYGNLIILDHGNGLTTRFGHLFGFNVRTGQSVHKGETIGTVGMTGRTTAPHLHYEVRQNDRPVNPRKYLLRGE